MSSSPNFLFVGTAKAGTTSLYHQINQHPEISIPVKETFFYLSEIYRDNNLPYPKQRPHEELILDEKQFKSLYADCESGMVGEVGTGYLYHHEEAIPLIKKFTNPDVRILIILRHPTDRCYSSYKHFAKDLHETCSFEDSLLKEEERKAENWDFMWFHKSMSMYAEQVEAYLNAFKHVKVLIYEEYAENSEKVTKELYEFLGVDPNFEAEKEKIYNTSGEPRFKTLQKMVTQENALKKALRPAFRFLFSKELREKIRKGVKNSNLKKSPPLSPQMKKELDHYFSEDIAKLEALIGRKIIAWER
ncbi:MAG: sulfotransferase [Flavobacteriales bacterium]|nr:sulfotransferase [Flavobacteriales bacterium]